MGASTRFYGWLLNTCPKEWTLRYHRADGPLPDRCPGEWMRCLKALEERISAPDPDRQAAEIHIRITLMNRFAALGTAEIVRVA